MQGHTIIVRNITDLEGFVASVHRETAHVRFLSIVFEPVTLIELDGEHSDPLDASESTKKLWRLLDEIGATLPTLDDLQAFSLQVRKGRNSFWIPRPLISTLLSKLPAACTTVEIDTLGSDRAEPGTIHLCDTIRAIVPKLKHLRLNLSTLCANAWQIDGECPKLTTLVISCFAGGFYNSRLCGSYTEDPVHSAFAQGEEAMPHLVRQIQTVANRLPQISRTVIYDQSGSNSYGEAFHQTYNRRELLKDIVTAMPMVYIYPFAEDGDGYMLRTPDGDVFGSLAALKAVLEEDIREQHGKDRALPQDSGEPQRLLSLNEWKAKYPKRSCVLWINEKRKGKRLVEACVVAGAASHVSLPVVPESDESV